MEKTTKSFDEYLSGLDDNKRETIAELDKMIVSRFGESNRSLWEGAFWSGSQQQIVGYGDYRSKRADNTCVEWFMFGIAVQKNYFSIYCNVIDGKQYLVKHYAERIGKVKTGSSNISFTKLEKLNLEVLAEMIDIAYLHWQNIKNAEEA